ncbi:TPA: lipopolysaccharide biosynthesis protein [Streptococcus suis]
MKKFLNRLLGFSLGPILGALISFFLVPLLTAFIPAAEYGKASLFSTLITILPFYIFLGLDQAYTREFQENEDKRNLLQQAAILPLGLGIGLVVISFIFSSELSTWLFGSEDYPQIVFLGGIWVLATILERFFLLSLRMQDQAFVYSTYNLILKINVFLVSMFFIAIGWRDFQVIVYGLLLGQLLGDLVLFWQHRYYFKFSGFHIDWPLIKRMIQFGLPIMVAVNLTNSLSAVDNLFLKQYRTMEEIGIYSVALKIMAVIGIVKTAFTSFWVPTAYRWYQEQKEMKYFKFISDAVLFVLTAMFFALLVFKSWIVLIVGEEFRQVQYLLGLMAFPHMMYTLSETTNLGIVFSRKTQFNILVSIAAFIPSVLLNYLLTPRYGFVGAATASFVAYLMFYFFRTYFSNRLGFSFSQRKQVLSILLMSFAALINAFEWPYAVWATLLLGLLALGAQWSTITQLMDIKDNPQAWNFD